MVRMTAWLWLGVVGACTNETPASLVVVDQASAADCPGGGLVVRAGADGNGDGVLSDDESTQREVLCSGATGATGGAGTDAEVLTEIDIVPPGTGDCGSGGVRVRVGTDADGDGALDDDEVASSEVDCLPPRGAAVDTFEGDLIVEDGLDALLVYGVRKVTGDLIFACDSCDYMDAFDQLTEVEGSLWFQRDADLGEITALNALETVGLNVSVESQYIDGISGLTSLRTIGKDLRLYFCGRLAHIDGLSALRRIEEDIYVNAAYELDDLSPLYGLEYVGEEIAVRSSDKLCDSERTAFEAATGLTADIWVLSGDDPSCDVQ